MLDVRSCTVYFTSTRIVAMDLHHGVQRRMISVVIFFVFLRLLFFALLLLYVTKCTLWRLCVAFLKC